MDKKRSRPLLIALPLILAVGLLHCGTIAKSITTTAVLKWYSPALKSFFIGEKIWLARTYEGSLKGSTGLVTSIDPDWELIIVMMDDGKILKFDMVIQASKILLFSAPK